jgi:hypothetical protein
MTVRKKDVISFEKYKHSSGQAYDWSLHYEDVQLKVEAVF